MTFPVVLDAEGLTALAEHRPPEPLRALLAEALRRNHDVVVPAVVCAEVFRGAARTRGVEAALARRTSRAGAKPAVEVVPTDLSLARQVGAVLHGSGADSSKIVDAHCVAVCVSSGGGMVVTGDPEDIQTLAQAVPSARIVTRRPR